MNIKKAIELNLGWLDSMHQKKGFSGPVTHYWKDSLNYIGPSLDWAYEGLIISFISLFEKTGQKEFLEKAVMLGDELVENQNSFGTFFNSNFESNPSIFDGSTPHETAACIGLMHLVKKLDSMGQNFEKYLNAVKKNIENFHLKILWDSKKEAFFQYRFDKKLHVPNKNATIVELLLLVDDFLKEEKYFYYAKKSSEFIIAQQHKNGGIFQSDSRKRIITFYTARCIPALIQMYKKTNQKKFLNSALKAGKFIEKMFSPKNGFYFGLMKQKNEWLLFKYPVFIAGSADIIRAIIELQNFGKKSVSEKIKWFLSKQNPNGSFPTSFGMNKKNQATDYSGKPFWRDIIGVVGWNDKALRLLVSLLKKREKIKPLQIKNFEFECEDAFFKETKSKIIISGKENFVFKKNAVFSSNNFFKKIILKLALIYSQIFKDYKSNSVGFTRKVFNFLLK